ncbi:hypothetical protein AVEN_176276-1 [Araneus ventricosus]|uniref:Uncharacterized protein n=1 Tax=Araneus ventricosus TaxID=182803 RepID=A0A4Y1ZN15_ARAVE|nr:hypothetical protein AVEN_238146-1 [Araneus ventricosus]GBO44668.1 hypothetical protein AVEN_176276-1 [Araneus ventricosus]
MVKVTNWLGLSRVIAAKMRFVILGWKYLGSVYNGHGMVIGGTGCCMRGKLNAHLVCSDLQRSAHQLPSPHCGRNSKVVPNRSTLCSSTSNSLLARTADRTQKTFALQGDSSRSTPTPSSKRSPYIVSRGRP